MLGLLPAFALAAAANTGFAPADPRPWFDYWRGRAAAEGRPFGIDPAAVAPGVVDLGRGTGFFVTPGGLLLTNYHVAAALCRIPEDGARGASIRCGARWRLRAFPSWLDYVNGDDFVIMSRGRPAPAALPLRADRPALLDRVFLAAYADRIYSPGRLAELAKDFPLQVGNSGPRRWLGRPALSWSTGRVTALAPDGLLWTDPNRFPGALPDLAGRDGYADPFPAQLPGGAGSSGAPLLDENGRVLGLAYGDNRYIAIERVVRALRLCSVVPGDAPFAELKDVLLAQGLCLD